MRNVLKRIPAVFLAATGACLVLGEWYPFSHFPMYATFGEVTFYLYLTDERGRPIATQDAYGLRNPELKRLFMGNRDRIYAERRGGSPRDADRSAAAATLAQVRRIGAARGVRDEPALRLWRVYIFYRGGAIVRHRELIASSAPA